MSGKTDMRLNAYLEQLLGSRVAISLVRALVRYKSKVFTVRGLADAARVSNSEAAVVVGQLEKHGIITVQPVGRSYMVSLNEKSYALNRIIKPMLKAEGETVAELVSLLKRHLDDKSVISAAVFGSVARGEEREDSDIDLLVVSNDFELASSLVSKAQEEVSLVFSRRLSQIILSEEEIMAKKDGRLLRSIVDSHIAVSGKDLLAVAGQ